MSIARRFCSIESLFYCYCGGITIGVMALGMRVYDGKLAYCHTHASTVYPNGDHNNILYCRKSIVVSLLQAFIPNRI